MTSHDEQQDEPDRLTEINEISDINEITDMNEVRSILDRQPSSPTFQVDFLKTWMMLLVIMDHTFSHAFLGPLGAIFWERISIPLFLIIMGYNMALSFRKQGLTTLSELYSWGYFRKKIERYIMPYLLLYGFHLLLRLFVIWQEIPVNRNFPYDLMDYMWLGYTPFYGPGMWFIPVVISSIFVFPFLYWCYLRQPIITVMFCIMIELSLHLLSYILYLDAMAYFRSELLTNIDLGIAAYPETSQFWGCHIFSHCSAIAIGMWLSTDHSLSAQRNIWVKVLVLIGIIYVGAFYFYRYTTISANLVFVILYMTAWIGGDYHLFTYAYAAGIFLLVMNFIPAKPYRDSRFTKLIQTISKATYHILLTQILYFSLIYGFSLYMFDITGVHPNGFDDVPLNYLWFYPLNVVVTFTGGILWHRLEQNFYEKQRATDKRSGLYRIIFIFAIMFYILRGNAQFVFFLQFP
ncbi:MAG: hypothetical protein E4G98_02110 [Promethearchaeota archaeon]|nr:MAG: hypothetical protein E4G98_02110 [Candidatus Lokiarchaeota archaeon]